MKTRASFHWNVGSFHGSNGSFHGSSGSFGCSQCSTLPWKRMEASTTSMEASTTFMDVWGRFYGRGSLYKLPSKQSSLFTPPIGQETGLLASYIIDCESCTWSISTNSTSTESAELRLMSGYDFVPSGADLCAVCPYPCWCHIGDDLLMQPGPPV